MKKIEKILILVLIILMLLKIIVTFSDLKPKNNNYEVYADTKSFPYKNTFCKYDDTPLIYYNNKEENSTYVRICTYQYMLKPVDRFYEKGKLVNPNDLVTVYSDANGDTRIELNMFNYKRESPDKFREIEGEWSIYEDYTAKDVNIYVKLNNMNCSQIELKAGLQSFTANASEPRSSTEIIDNDYSDNKKYISICNKNKYGLFDKNGNMVIDFISDKEILYNDKISRIVINRDGLDYLADFKGNIVSDGYDELTFINYIGVISERMKDYYSEYVFAITLKDGGKENRERQQYTGSFSIYDIDYRDKWGLLDKDGKLVVPILNPDYNYCFNGANFYVEKVEIRQYIIKDFNGNQIGNNKYHDIRKVCDDYYIADLTGDNILKRVVIDSDGKEVSDYYSSFDIANSELVLFSTGSGKAENYKIMDKNFKVRLDGVDFDKEDSKGKQQPLLRTTGIKEFKVDGVTVKNPGGILRLVYIDDDKVTIQSENSKGVVQKVITVQDGEIKVETK